MRIRGCGAGLLSLLLIVSWQVAGASQARLELAPGVKYDAAIPTLKQIVGHEPGDEITAPEGITAYLKSLAQAAPDRTKLIEYGRTWEGRPLHVLAVSSPERIARLDAIKADLKRLADPRGLSAADADRLVRELPVVTWLLHAVHGNEISSSDAALAEAHHLLAARGDAGVDAILRESIVLIDPLENPDGRARFVFQNLMGRGAEPDPEPASAEHDEPWPGGRSNHYLFDMNRDWLAQSQPETIGRAKILLDFYPHVVVDLHEMGGNSSYYFAPPADPINPHITKAQQSWFETFGRENAKRFDARGFSYFIRETYDSFYPGYGESWPIFQGAVGMTYEQASARGLAFRRDDDALLTYRDGVVRHFTAAIATAETAARNREKLLRDFLDYRRSAAAEGEKAAVREYLIPPGADPARSSRLARLLVDHGIEVRRSDEPIRQGTRTLPAGTFIVPAAQPASRLLRNLLDPSIAMDDTFVAEQERRRKKRLSDQIYDVTAWNLPLLFDVDVVHADKPTTAKTSPFSGAGEPAAPAAAARELPGAVVGYLLPWGTAAAATAADALAQGLRVRVAGEPFTLGGRAYPIGTAIVRTAENPAGLRGTLAAIANRHCAEVVPIDSAFVESGISLGSSRVSALKPPRVLLLWDAPTQSLSAGWARFVLERRYNQRVTAVRGNSFARIDLSRYNVIVLPSGNYTSIFGEEPLRRLKDWIRAGGTLVTIAEASRWASGERVALLETRTEMRDGTPEGAAEEKKPSKPEKPFDLEKAIQPERERPEALPGALLRVKLDLEHWLSAGLDGDTQGMVEGARVFVPIRLDRGRNVGVYEKKDRLLAAGLAWEESRDQLAQKAFLIHQPMGQGHVIAFAEDPNFRALAEATQLLFINAVILGPGY